MHLLENAPTPKWVRFSRMDIIWCQKALKLVHFSTLKLTQHSKMHPHLNSLVLKSSGVAKDGVGTCPNNMFILMLYVLCEYLT